MVHHRTTNLAAIAPPLISYHLLRFFDVGYNQSPQPKVSSCMGKMSQDSTRYNTELFWKTGVAFVMRTIGGDRDLLYKNWEQSKLYAVISPQMGKHGCDISWILK
uniref:Uncharacterized protein n=1 Tax=Lactuca sativa TaxID=4236 RepID=A0A9R1VSS3_LACSA|nr:hypothetical protein LSAT_V11C400199450 [Lactuca sativa]